MNQTPLLSLDDAETVTGHQPCYLTPSSALDIRSMRDVTARPTGAVRCNENTAPAADTCPEENATSVEPAVLERVRAAARILALGAARAASAGRHPTPPMGTEGAGAPPAPSSRG